MTGMTSWMQTFLLLALTVMTSGSKVDLQADKTSGGLRLRCSLEKDGDASDQPDIAFVNSILISSVTDKEELLVASITPYFAPRAFGESGGKPQVNGKLDKDIGYIEVTWPPHDPVRSGDYDCIVTGIAVSGVSHKLKKSVEVKSEEEEETEGQLMKYILDLQSTLDEVKNTTEKHSSFIEDFQTITGRDSTSDSGWKQTLEGFVSVGSLDNIKSLRTERQHTATTLKQHGESLIELQLVTQLLQLELSQLVARVNTRVYFTAGLETDQRVNTNGVIVFDKVITQVIQLPPPTTTPTTPTTTPTTAPLTPALGYNPATGQFMCPLSGHYQFHVTVVDKVVNVSLQVNGAGVVSLVAWHQLVYLTGANSAILHLAQGDLVTVVADYKTLLVGNMFPVTTFSGRLIDL